MALEATHIRFALELKDRFHVVDTARYVCGAIYPDSRYVTKIARDLTHPKDYETWDIDSCDDFKKGWFTHLLCDETQRTIMVENSNGENVEKLARYNRIFQTTYADPAHITLDSYNQMWQEFGIGDDLKAKTMRQAWEYSQDADVVALIGRIFSEMLRRAWAGNDI